MNLYETTFIARQELSPKQVDELAHNFSEILKANGGEIRKTELCGLRPLAYRINKNRKGHYIIFYIASPAAALSEMERQMRHSEDILRFLSVRVEAFDNRPSALMQGAMYRPPIPLGVRPFQRNANGQDANMDLEDDLEEILDAPEDEMDLAALGDHK